MNILQMPAKTSFKNCATQFSFCFHLFYAVQLSLSTILNHDVVDPQVSVNNCCERCVDRTVCASSKFVTNPQLIFNIRTQFRI